ncbi:MAG: DUF2871 domain-containing protein [Christensenellales bacterium]|jgi:ABC-type spermidine/putrescine transport system permease subunit II
MKKLINRAFLHAMFALAGGVFYREFTKWNGFEGRTVLAFVHPHLLLMGSFLLLIAALFAKQLPLLETKRFKTFLALHTAGLPFMVVMMLVRGVLQVLGTNLSRGMDAAISGIAGIGHCILGASIVYLFLALKSALPKGAA